MAKTILLIIKASNKINYSNTNTHSHAHADIKSIGKDVYKGTGILRYI